MREETWRALKEIAHLQKESTREQRELARDMAREHAQAKKREAQERAQVKEREAQELARAKERDERDERERRAWEQELKELNRRNELAKEEMHRQIGGLGNKWGSFTEGLALPSMQKILSRRFRMDLVQPHARSEDKRTGRTLEIDVLAYSGSVDEVYLVEVKSHLRQEGLDQIKEALREFHDFFPGHRGKKLYGILAAVDVPDQLREKVLREGIYLARIHGDQFELGVPAGFRPRAF